MTLTLFAEVLYVIFKDRLDKLLSWVMVMIVWWLNLQLPMQSVPIIT